MEIISLANRDAKQFQSYLMEHQHHGKDTSSWERANFLCLPFARANGPEQRVFRAKVLELSNYSQNCFLTVALLPDPEPPTGLAVMASKMH